MTTGYLREKDDIKYFILFSMDRLPFPVGEPELLDICLIDDAFGYFEFSEAFAELQSTGHVRRLEDEEGRALYTITPLGREASQIFQEDLPISVRDKAQAAAARVVRKIRRDSSITAFHTPGKDGTFQVHLAISDPQETVLSMDVQVMNRRQCARVEKNFRQNAESVYSGILELLLEEKPPEGEKNR